MLVKKIQWENETFCPSVAMVSHIRLSLIHSSIL